MNKNILLYPLFFLLAGCAGLGAFLFYHTTDVLSEAGKNIQIVDKLDAQAYRLYEETKEECAQCDFMSKELFDKATDVQMNEKYTCATIRLRNTLGEKARGVVVITKKEKHTCLSPWCSPEFFSGQVCGIFYKERSKL